MKEATRDIRQLLSTYERSLNTSDAALAASCYTADGVFMPTTLPTATGAQLTTSYTQIFEAIRLNIKFSIEELVVASETVAYGLTASAGTVTVLANGAEVAEANREIFVFAKENGAWKIARYMFNKAA